MPNQSCVFVETPWIAREHFVFQLLHSYYLSEIRIFVPMATRDQASYSQSGVSSSIVDISHTTIHARNHIHAITHSILSYPRYSASIANPVGIPTKIVSTKNVSENPIKKFFINSKVKIKSSIWIIMLRIYVNYTLFIFILYEEYFVLFVLNQI